MKQKKIISLLGALCSLTIFFAYWSVSASFNNIPSDNYKNLNKDHQTIVETDNIEDPLRDGSYGIAEKVQGLYMKQGRLTTFLKAQDAALAYAQNIINWTLFIVWTVALIYLLYTGFQMITSSWDETKFKERTKRTRSALIGLLGIGLSAIFVNFVLYVIDKVV